MDGATSRLPPPPPPPPPPPLSPSPPLLAPPVAVAAALHVAPSRVKAANAAVEAPLSAECGGRFGVHMVGGPPAAAAEAAARWRRGGRPLCRAHDHGDGGTPPHRRRRVDSRAGFPAPAAWWAWPPRARRPSPSAAAVARMVAGTLPPSSSSFLSPPRSSLCCRPRGPPLLTRSWPRRHFRRSSRLPLFTWRARRSRLPSPPSRRCASHPSMSQSRRRWLCCGRSPSTMAPCQW